MQVTVQAHVARLYNLVPRPPYCKDVGPGDEAITSVVLDQSVLGDSAVEGAGCSPLGEISTNLC